jgi:SAM-dependent methyltransferase
VLSKVRKLICLITSAEPRDQIFLQRRLDNVPLLGPSRKWARTWRAKLSQRSTEDYVRMQKRTYELYASADRVSSQNIEGDYVVGSWKKHDDWSDYEDYLMKYVPPDETWTALEYGCGPGRNIRRWSPLFERVDGVDISATNLNNARAFLQHAIPDHKKPNLYITDGMDCGQAPWNYYDFAFSTICLQHICVHKVRYSILQSLFGCLKQEGRLSIQMGFGVPSPNTVDYYANFVGAVGTNRVADVAVSSPHEIQTDLEEIGFVQFEHWIRPVGPGDVHPNWIYFTAIKPKW